MEVLTAWKAVRSVATVTGDEVLGEVNDAGSAWKAVRLRKCHMYFGVVPSRHIVFRIAYPGTSYPVTVATLSSAFQALNSNTFFLVYLSTL